MPRERPGVRGHRRVGHDGRDRPLGAAAEFGGGAGTPSGSRPSAASAGRRARGTARDAREEDGVGPRAPSPRAPPRPAPHDDDAFAFAGVAASTTSEVSSAIWRGGARARRATNRARSPSRRAARSGSPTTPSSTTTALSSRRVGARPGSPSPSPSPSLSRRRHRRRPRRCDTRACRGRRRRLASATSNRSRPRATTPPPRPRPLSAPIRV